MATAISNPHSDTETEIRQTQADKLLEIASDNIRLSQTPDGDAYAQLLVKERGEIKEHWETHPLRAKVVKDWLIHAYRKMCNSVPNKAALEQAMSALEADARFDGATQEVYLRLAWHDDVLYLDLANDCREVVRLTKKGWEVTQDAPVLFRRPPAMRPLPTPKRGGKIDRLKPFLNLPDDNDKTWKLVIAWLLGTLHPTGPYPVLALHGEKGSAKSTTTRYLRAIVDPASADAPEQPRDAESLTLTAHHNWIAAFDNMSSMPRWLSDGLCRLSTGAGSSKRMHYENSDVMTFKAKRPCIINGIEELANAGDLLDRAIIATLPVIDKKHRKTEKALNADFAREQPYILGALLDAAVAALRGHESAKLEDKPRLADFAEWVVAAEQTLGWEPGAFMKVYGSNQDEAQGLEIEASPVASAVVKFMENTTRWEGSATTLLDELRRVAGENAAHSFNWPKNGSKLSGTLTRVAGALRSQGIEVGKSNSGGRTITLVKGKQAADPPHTDDASRTDEPEQAEPVTIPGDDDFDSLFGE